MKMKINNKEEKQNFLESNIKGFGSYALATYNNHTEPVWIVRFKNWNKDNSDWFLESPCCLKHYHYDLNNKEDFEWVQEQGLLIKDNNVYEIDSPQTAPFLPDKLDDLTLISEEECFEWMLANRKDDK